MTNPAKEQLVIFVINDLKRIKNILEQIDFDSSMSDSSDSDASIVSAIALVDSAIDKLSGDKIKIDPKQMIDGMNRSIGNADLSVDSGLKND